MSCRHTPKWPQVGRLIIISIHIFQTLSIFARGILFGNIKDCIHCHTCNLTVLSDRLLSVQLCGQVCMDACVTAGIIIASLGCKKLWSVDCETLPDFPQILSKIPVCVKQTTWDRVGVTCRGCYVL